MALIVTDHPALSGDQEQFWKDELSNSRILLYEIDKAINALSKNEVRQFSINTGQNSQSVTRQDIPQLLTQRLALIKQIADLEDKINDTGPSALVVRPW